MDRRRNVRDTYDRIAAHFAATREYAWPEVRAFVEEATVAVEGGIVGLDVGCGNCRHAELLANRCERVVGLDASRGLLEAGRERALERGFADGLALVQGDAAALPLERDAVALGVYVATLHHLPTRDARVASLAELERVLAPGGRALVSAWSVEHERFDRAAGFDTTIDWTLSGGETVERFYHVYDAEEFAADLDRGGLAVIESEVSSGNCYATVATDD